MMFRLMYRLKKKHGAVLFAVIAVMALLIAMSTAAYYTARGSYNTVASSYNYSQLYLSAIASADMVSAAIMNQPVPSAATQAPGDHRNNFQTIKDEIRDHLNNINDVIYLKTSNLQSVTVNASTSQQTIINALNSGGNPTEPGVLDGLTVAIKVLDKGAQSQTIQSSNTVGNTTTTVYDVKTPFTYEITTTAYYRENTITVQDILTGTKAGTYTKTETITPGSPSSSLPSDFNPNIATGQNQPNTSGQWQDADRTVIISVKEINGDMAFRNKVTIIGGNANLGNVLNGGLVSEGSIYLKKGGAQVTGTDNNWYIRDDLVIADAQAQLDLGQNDLYVGGDLVISANGGPVTARDVYVNGDLVILNQKNFNVENLHVNGNIYFATVDENGNTITEAFTRPEIQGQGFSENYGGDPGSRLGGNFNLSLRGNVHTKGQDANGNSISADKVTLGKYQNLTNGASHSETTGIQDFDVEANTKHDYTVLTTNKNTDKYEKVSATGSTIDALTANTNYTTSTETPVKSVYPNYTAGQKAYDNEATIDFGALDEVKNAEGATTGYRGEFPIGSTGEYIVVTIDSPDKWNTDDIQIDIPYVEDGFVLKYESTTTESYWDPTKPNEWGGLGAMVTTSTTVEGLGNVLSDQNILHYNIDTDPSGKSMPIVLAANQDDGNFSWAGSSSVKGADVSVNGNGKVTFEMGNKNKETGEYEPFKVENADKYEIPTYVQGKTGQQFSVVGSADQVTAAMNGQERFDNLTVDQAKAMPQRSNVMLVSNKSGEAFNANGKDGLFCGYIYAPNGTLYADNQTNGDVINVGSIVISSYEANHANYQVSLPTPQDMSDFIDALDGDTGVNWNGGGGGGGGGNALPQHDINETDISYTSVESWTLIGSNYIGDPVISVSEETPSEETPAA